MLLSLRYRLCIFGETQLKAFYLLLVLAALWHLAPLLFVLSRRLPLQLRCQAVVSLFKGGMVSLLVLIPDLLAPLVVPVALLFTKREDNQLPWLFRWWDNDKSINGDWPEYQDPNYQGTTYYANYPPRSFMARYIWLGLRNRASYLALILGHQWTAEEAAQPHQVWGTRSEEGKSTEGWALLCKAGVYQLYRVSYLGQFLGHVWCLRTNYGHKIGFAEDGSDRAMVVGLSASILGWQGPVQ